MRPINYPKYTMINSKILAISLCAAASVSAANANSYNDSSRFAYQTERDAVIGANIGGGYLFDLEEAYAVAAFGIDVGADSFVGIQLMHMSDNDKLDLFGDSLELDVDALAVGAVWRGYHAVDHNAGFYYSASAGIVNYDVDGRVRSSGETGSESDSSFYIDGAVGYQQYFSDNVAFNLGIRLLHLDNAKVEDQGIRLETDFDSLYVGVEAGLVFRF